MNVFRVGFDILVEAESQEDANSMVQTFLRKIYEELGWEQMLSQMTPDELKKVN